MSDPVLLIHAGATWFMVGLIWFVQVVHYPLFRGVGADGWRVYAARHQARTSWVVLPVMLVELSTAVMLVPGPGVGPAPGALPWVGAGLLALIWISTFAVQVPLHARLGTEHSPRAMSGLVKTNWIRTVAWSARGVIALAMIG